MAQNTGAVQSVERALDIVETLKSTDGAGVTELADHLDMPTSTVYNYLQTLHEREFVRKQDGTYELADRFVHFGDFAKLRHPLYRSGKPNVVWLAEETGQTVNLLIEEYGRGIYLLAESRETHLRNFSHVRRREYLHSTAAGKAILMVMDDDEVAEVLDTHGQPARTSSTITDRSELLDAVDRARERGYAINDQENTAGVRAVGVPVESPEGPYGSLSLSVLASRHTVEDLHETFAPTVQDTAEAINLELRS